MSSTSVGVAIILGLFFFFDVGFCVDVGVAFFNVSELLLLVEEVTFWFTLLDVVALVEAGSEDVTVETEGPLLSRRAGVGVGFSRLFPDEAKES